jgi:hypothetical protein
MFGDRRFNQGPLFFTKLDWFMLKAALVTPQQLFVRRN